jgi:mono/diheme cytochrome c family protein
MIHVKHLIFLSGVVIAAAVGLVSCKQGTTDQGEPPALSGAASYAKNCQGCHGARGEGVGEYPKLQKLNVRIPHDDQVTHIIRNGRGKMPGYKQMSDAELKALIAYIRTL